MSTERFAHNLQKLREEREWTQKDLARASGVSRRTISRYEWGGVKPRRKNLIKLADALGCTPESLWSGRRPPREERSERKWRIRKLMEMLQGSGR